MTKKLIENVFLLASFLENKPVKIDVNQIVEMYSLTNQEDFTLQSTYRDDIFPKAFFFVEGASRQI